MEAYLLRDTFPSPAGHIVFVDSAAGRGKSSGPGRAALFAMAPTMTTALSTSATEANDRRGLRAAPSDVGKAAGGDGTVKRGMLRGLVKTLRPHQWVKNLFVFAPMFFHRDVFMTVDGTPALNLRVTGWALLATAIFCLLAGAVYTINDLADVEADRLHPVKRFRPIASGDVPEGVARLLAGVLVVGSLGAAYAVGPSFALVAAAYFVLNVAYTFKLKQIAFIDVGVIALGFVLRVLAGGYAAGVHVSSYMIACTALLALFLGFGKRRHELASENAGKQRAALEAYGPRSLNVALTVTGLATAITYVFYTLDRDTRAFFHSDMLWITVPFTVFGIGRFLLLVSGRAGRGLRAESPTQEMLRDVPFVQNLVLWVVVVVAIVYKLRPQG
jgi:4-hydroxybenzoate polyprenyltransferase